MAEESRTKLIPTDEVVDAKIVAALEEPLRKLSEHDKSLAGKAESSSVYDKKTVDSKVKATGDAISEHVANNTRHITDSEREIWNNKPDSGEIYTRQQSDQRFSHIYHEHTNDGWFTSAINAIKTLIPTLPSWLTPTLEEPPTKEEVELKYTKPNDGIPLSDLKPSTFPPTAHSHASDNWFTTAINSKADEAKPSFSTITINGVDYTEWTLGTRSGKIMLSVDMGGISTEIAAFNPVTGVFESAPSQYRNTLRFDGEAPVVGASPTLFDHVARKSALSGKADVSHTHAQSDVMGLSAVLLSKLDQTGASDLRLNGGASIYFDGEEWLTRVDSMVSQYSWDWSSIYNTPTTLAGYGIEDAAKTSDIPSLSGQTFDISVDAQFKNMCIAMARALGATVTHASTDDSTGASVAMMYGINPTDTTTFGELQTKAGLGDSAVIGDL